jgi:hypothetical protein
MADVLKRPLFLVFEPTNHLYQVIAAADRRGFDVVVFHSIPILTAGPYAKYAGHIALAHPMRSWEDPETCLAEVFRVCDGHDIAGTYAAQEITLEIEAGVREKVGLPTKSPAAVRELLNKLSVRRRLRDSGLSRLRCFTEADLDALETWPVGDRAIFVKPVHGAGSAFVKRCTDLGQLRAAMAEWRAAEKASIPVLGPYLVSDGDAIFGEEEAVGELLSVEGYVYDGEFHALGVASRTVLQRDIAVEMGATYPYDHPRHDEIIAVVERMHTALGVEYGPTHTEVIVPAEGDIELVELNIRFIGADLLAGIDAAHGVRFEDDLVELGTGSRPRLELRRDGYASVQYLLPPLGLRRLESLELPDEDLPFVKIIRPPGSDIASTERQIDWIAAFAVRGSTYAEAVERANDIRRRTRVNGRPLGDDPNNVVIAR